MHKFLLFIILISFIIAGGFATNLALNDYLFMKDFEQNSQSITATVTDSLKKISNNSDGSESINYEIHVEYIVNSIEYYSHYNSSTYIPVNSKVNIYYYLDNPIIISTTQQAFIVPVLISSSFLIIGLCFPLKFLIKLFKIFKLKTSGTKIYATITRVSVDYSIRINKKYTAAVLECEYRDYSDGNTYTFKKGKISNIRNLINSNIIGKEIEVFVHPTNFNNYFINHKNIR